ncbi:MAG: hypothetical protein NTZ10_06115 [Candidatus Saganbacteria bacterium]|nr:hypothetical protein [Candidatus Saganbacteria bacterium]
MKKVFLAIAGLVFLAQIASAFSINVDPPSIWETMGPGSSRSGKIMVENRGSGDIVVNAYTEDWVFLKDRSKEFKKAGTTRYSCANWIVLYPTNFILGSGKTQEVKYTISMPSTAQGGYYSVIFFESRLDSRASTKRSNVILLGRIGSIVYAETQGASRKAAAITNLSFKKLSAKKPYEAIFTVANEGNSAVSPEGSIIITDDSARLYAKIDIKKFYVLQGERIPVKAYWAGALPEGEYSVIATLDLGTKTPVTGVCKLVVGGSKRK